MTLKLTRYIPGFMCSVFHRHGLGHRRCGSKRFRHRRQKSVVVGDCIGPIYRVFNLFDLRVSQRQEVGRRNLAFDYIPFYYLVKFESCTVKASGHLQLAFGF